MELFFDENLCNSIEKEIEIKGNEQNVCTNFCASSNTITILFYNLSTYIMCLIFKIISKLNILPLSIIFILSFSFFLSLVFVFTPHLSLPLSLLPLLLLTFSLSLSFMNLFFLKLSFLPTVYHDLYYSCHALLNMISNPIFQETSVTEVHIKSFPFCLALNVFHIPATFHHFIS